MPSTRRIVFFDLETAGLNAKRHPILQIAAIAVDEGLQPVERFEAKVRFDESRANRISLRKNHYHRGVWAKNALEPEDAAKRFAEFLRRHATVTKLGSDGEPYHLAQLVAHNASFDAEFLWAWYERLYMYLPARYQVFCTLQRAMWYFQEHREETPPDDFKLATLCHHFGVPFHAASAHDALADVSATLALYRAMQERSAHLESIQKIRPDTPDEHTVLTDSKQTEFTAFSLAPVLPAR
jgi:DNA polymerase III epsilon subunit-like protein